MIYAYAYRTPRIAIRLPLEFVTESGVLTGHTLDISAQGLRADFGEPISLMSTGRLRLRVDRCLLELEAHVCHAEGYAGGLVFDFVSDAERSFVRAVLQVLNESAQHLEAGGSGP